MKEKIKKVAAPFRLLWGYYFDSKKFKKGSFEFNRNRLSIDNLRGKITFEYHAIEKGLIHDDLRLGFGVKRISELLRLLNIWKDRNIDTSDKRYQAGISVLERYIEVHEMNNFNVDNLKKQVISLKGETNIKVTAGEITLKKEDILSNAKGDFYKFSYSRHSIRDFSNEKISLKKLEEAVTLAGNAPSACNRQSSKVYLIQDEDTIGETLKIQNGIQGMAKNISALLLVTADNQYFGSLNERNQSFIDGGIFTMNLLYSLTYYDIANCVLNADLNTKSETKIKKLFNVSNREDLIAFIAIGSYPDEFKVPVSTRDTTEDILKVVENR